MGWLKQANREPRKKSTMASYSLSSIAPKTGNIWKPAVGEIVDGTIVYVGDLINDDFDKKGGKQRELRIDLEVVGGDKVTVFGTLSSADLPNSYPNRLVTAVAEAVERGGGRTDIETGARLQLQRVEDVSTTRGSPARNYVAVYTRPSAMVNLAAATPVQTMQTIQPSPPTTQAPILDYAAVAAATGVPETVLGVMTPEQIASLLMAQPAPSAPSTVQTLSSLLSQPNG
jgi:hypothetical protein